MKHLGTTLTDAVDEMGQNILEKLAQYIPKNNELTREFHYEHPSTKVFANNIFNTQFYGAPLWHMFSPAFQKLEKTWNTSHRLMLSLPLRTHRYLIEPLTGSLHIINSLWKRFLKFINCSSVSTTEYAELGETRLLFDYGKKFKKNLTDGKPRRLR